MNFTLVSPGTKDYNKLMMQKHLQQKKIMPLKNYEIHLRDHQSLESPTNPKHNSITEDKTQIVPPIRLSGGDENSNIYQNCEVKNKKQKNITIDCQKMRKMIKDQLEESVAEQSLNKRRVSNQWNQTKKIMAKENGMLDYLEKQENKRNQFIKKCLLNQEMFQSRFIDDNSLKNSRIFEHISSNYDPDVFNHQSDKYQMMQRINNAETWNTNNQQRVNLQERKEAQKREYGVYFDQKVKNKHISQNIHNPLTNPLEYHVDNPYLRKKMMRY